MGCILTTEHCQSHTQSLRLDASAQGFRQTLRSRGKQNVYKHNDDEKTMLSDERILYIWSSRNSTRHACDITNRHTVTYLTPDEINEHAPLGEVTVSVIDCFSLSETEVPEIVHRLRWLGFEGHLVVTSFEGTELDRALLMDAGADRVSADSLAELATMPWPAGIPDTNGFRNQPAHDGRGQRLHRGSQNTPSAS